MTVSYQTADGTVSAGFGYSATSGTVTILAGSSTAEITVPTIDEGANEPSDAYFCVELTGASDAAGDSIAATGTATAYLQSNSSSLNLSITGPSTLTLGSTTGFPLTLSNPDSTDITVSYQVAEGSSPGSSRARGRP